MYKVYRRRKNYFQRANFKFVLEHNIPVDLVLNLDETSLSYISPGKYTFDLKGSTTVPIKGVDDKRRITATFTVSAFFITYSTHL